LLSYCYKKPAGCIISGLFLCFFLAFSYNANAQSGTPFLTRNQSPLSLIYGIPYASPARLLEQNKSRWISSLNISNELINQTGSNDQLLVDLETWQLNIFYDYGFIKNWMFRLQLPLISHTGGILDSPIDSFHQALGFPEGLRPRYPQNQIAINYSQNNTNQINITSNQKDLGDISLQLAWQSKKSNNMAISYWSSIKLPTGNHKKLTGSGSTDIATWASIDYQLNNTRWLYGQAGLLYMYNNKVLKAIHNKWATFANFGIKFQPWQPIILKTQIDFNSALFDSNIRFMSDAFQLTFGGSYLLNEKHKIDFSIGEDIKRNSSPDVSFNISWWVNF
jgi:Protein of unknown function (DUF3187)